MSEYLLKILVWVIEKIPLDVAGKYQLKVKHDKEIFGKISDIVNDEEMFEIIEYFSQETRLKKYDDKRIILDVFSQQIGNEFIDSDLNKLFKVYIKTLVEINQLYSDSIFSVEYGEYTRLVKITPDISIKDNQDYINKLSVQNRMLSEDLRKNYDNFRKKIKEKLFI